MALWQTETLFEEQRAWLVRRCAALCGNTDAAEDLAQETLIEAWRQRHKLRDPGGARPWLATIAQYVYLRWQRRGGRDRLLFAPPDATDQAAAVADQFDLEREMERDELALLLDRALALLPPDTRAVLIEKYVHESPYAEIAARLGVSEGAVTMRVQRGKLAFQRILKNELRPAPSACSRR